MTEDQEPESNEPEAKAASGLAAFWKELRRRHVVRVAITYAVVAWLIMQVAGPDLRGIRRADMGVPLCGDRAVVVFSGGPDHRAVVRADA